MGRLVCPLRIAGDATKYEEQIALDNSVEAAEPLLFLISRVLNDLCERLRSRAQAARQVHIQLHLEKLPDRESSISEYLYQLKFAVPLQDGHAILKLVQLEIERRPPPARVNGFALSVDPVDPRIVRNGPKCPLCPSSWQLCPSGHQQQAAEVQISFPAPVSASLGRRQSQTPVAGAVYTVRVTNCSWSRSY
jgi:hypothetical protein